MSDPTVQDAARLVAFAPAQGVLPPRETDLGVAWLDLREAACEAAACRAAARVARGVAACLELQGDAWLVVSTGGVPPRVVARAIGEGLAERGHFGLTVARIVGEDVADRAEEVLAAVCYPLYQQSAATALVAAPPEVLRDARQRGAKIVVAAGPCRATVEAAAAGLDRAATGERAAVVRWVTGYRVSVVLGRDLPPGSHEELLRLGSPGREVNLVSVQGRTILEVSARERSAVEDACVRAELLVPGFALPRAEGITTTYESRRVPLRYEMFDWLLEFGCDLRPAAEWADS